jgi:hypothetical protein
MTKYTVLIMLIVGFLMAGCGPNAAAPQPIPTAASSVTTVEVIYLDHGPVRSVLTDINQLLEGYGEQVRVIRYDFNTPEGEAFAQSHDLSGHSPLVIFVNDSMDFTLGDRAIEFYSFPQGRGTGVVPDGAWTIDDLQQVLDQAVKKS